MNLRSKSREMTMRLINGLVLSVLVASTVCARCQAPADVKTERPMTEDDIAVLRQDVQVERTEIITRNMNFTETQAKAFWPIYREYAHEQQMIGNQRIALIKDYAMNHDSIDDVQAESLVERALKLEQEGLDLKKKYVPRFTKAMGARETAKFFQVDNRLNLLTNVQLASLLPIIK